MMTEDSADLLISKIRQDTENEAAALISRAETVRSDRQKSQEGWEKREKRDWERRTKEYRKEQEERDKSSFRMERKRLFLQAREEVMKRIEEEAMHRLEQSTSSPWYREVLKRWITEGVLGLREKDIILKGAAGDLALMNTAFLDEVTRELRESAGLTVRLTVDRENPELVPGVLLSTADGRVSFNNQLPARFSRLKARVRRVVSSGLKDEYLTEGADNHE